MQSNLILNIFLSTAETYFLLGIIILIIIAFVSIATAISKKRERKASQAKEEAKYEAKKDAGYSYFDLNDDLDIGSNVDYTASHQDVMRSDSKQISIMLKPIKNKPRPLRKVRKKEVEYTAPLQKESSFNKDHIYNEEVSRKPGIISMYLDVEGFYRFKLITSANETVAISKAHATRFSCIRAMRLAIIAGKYAEVTDSTDTEYLQMLRVYIFEISRDLENRFRFKLKTGTLQDILVSPGYTSKFNCINGVKSVRNILEFHSLRDDTSNTFVANFEEEVRAIWQDVVLDEEEITEEEQVKASVNY